MKRAHRRWLRVIGCLLLPGLAATLTLLIGPRGAPPANAALPPALAAAPADESR